MPHPPIAATTALVLGLAGLAQAQQQVEVVGTSPLPGQGIERDRLPYATQVIRRDALDAGGGSHLGDQLVRRLPAAQIADVQGSPLQGDFSFRGFRASGLLGAAQGLSVFLDGVRINEAFGDVVNWDLIPEFALASVSIVSGANPAFGLNALGGSIALTSASGVSAPGVRGEASLGSFGRRKLQASIGLSNGEGWHLYAGAGAFEERGWRDHSPGRNVSALVKLGHRAGPLDWNVTLLGARSALIGNGLVPLDRFEDEGPLEPDLLSGRWSAVYSHPDRTEQRLGQWSFSAGLQLNPQLRAQALLFSRSTRRSTLNGDVLDHEEDDAEDDERAPGRARALRERRQDESDEPNAALNRSQTRQRSNGLSLALEGRSGAHQWQIGASAERSRVAYEQTEQEGFFDATRGVAPADETPELSVQVSGSSSTVGLYASDTWQIAPDTFVTATLRLNRARVSNTLGSVDDDSDVFESHPKETFRYRSANPALGISHRLQPALTLHANLARNTRVPTVLELGCADPDEPCRLPAGLQSDPYLAPVRAFSQELGARWRPADGHRVEAVLWRIDSRDDILFSSVSASSQLGYFRNFGRTRRQGLELTWQGSAGGGWSWQAGFASLDASYRSAGLLRVGERNIAVTPGMAMLGLPRQALKLALERRMGAFTASGDLQWSGRRGVPGNEDGLTEDGATQGRDLSLPGYAVLNLQLAWKPSQSLELALGLHNAADRRAASFGALAESAFDAQGRFGGEADARFVAPITPRAWTLVLRWRL